MWRESGKLVWVASVLGAGLVCLACGGAWGQDPADLPLNTPAAWPDAYPDYNTDPADPVRAGMEATAAELAERMGVGWNLGNTFEAIGGVTAWGNPVPTRAFFELVKASGFDSVRLPVSWNQYADLETAAIDPAWLDLVAQAVEDAVASDLIVVVNVHWDGSWLEGNVTPEAREKVTPRQRALWQQIATRLRDFDERVVFASANEPHAESAEAVEVLMGYHRTFIDAVRETGGQNAYRVLAVQGPNTDFELTDKLWGAMPEDTVDDRLMMEVHFYTPYNFTLMSEDADWGNQFYYWGKGNHSPTDSAHNPTWGEEATIDRLFDLMEERFVDKGVPVIVGEYSTTWRGNLTGESLRLHNASRAAYLEYVTRAAMERGMVPFYWDNGPAEPMSSGLFDRHEVRVADPAAIEAVMQGAGR